MGFKIYDEDGLRLNGQIGTLQRIFPKTHSKVTPCRISVEPISTIKNIYDFVFHYHKIKVFICSI